MNRLRKAWVRHELQTSSASLSVEQGGARHAT